MGISAPPKAPTPTDPNITAANQQNINQQAFRDTMSGNTIGQSNAYGTLDYETEIDPITNQPKYRADLK